MEFFLWEKNEEAYSYKNTPIQTIAFLIQEIYFLNQFDCKIQLYLSFAIFQPCHLNEGFLVLLDGTLWHEYLFFLKKIIKKFSSPVCLNSLNGERKIIQYWGFLQDPANWTSKFKIFIFNSSILDRLNWAL